MAYAASPRRARMVPNKAPVQEINRLDWRGIDFTSPYDVVQDNRSPYARNFRIYAQEKDDRRVAITNRKGSAFYSTPISETVDQQNTSTTGAADQSVGVDINWKAMKFTAGATGPLTKVELRLKKDSASKGPIIIEIYTDNAGTPGVKIADSGILSASIATSYAYVVCRFIEAPSVTSGTSYWAIAHTQDDGLNSYYWSSNTSTTLAKTSNTSGLGWNATAYSLNMKTYVSSTAKVKGISRYTPSTAANQTLVAIGNNIYSVNDSTGATTSIISGLNSSASNVYITYADNKAFIVNGYDTVRTWDSITAGTITHTNLPTLKLATFHANRLVGIAAGDENKLIFSEDPGNDDGAGNTWYSAYLSTSFIYIPSPKANDPITAIIPFQDNLIVFTTTTKYILYGTDPGSFVVRQSTGKKGAVSQNAVVSDENYVYFVSDDGVYRYNGATDELISDKVQTEISNIADPLKTSLVRWKRQIRMYYPTSGNSFNNRTLIWDTQFQEWMLDTDTQISMAVAWTDGNDPKELAEASSVSPAVFLSEKDDNNLGKAIDFAYYCKYDSMKSPGHRKRIVRFIPLLQADGGNYPVGVAMDKDLNDSAPYNLLQLQSSGNLIGSFDMNDGVVIGNVTEFNPKRVPVAGYAHYWQVRIARKAINNPIQFIGYILSFRQKKL